MAQKIRNKVALITGITGQDGSYLAEFLLEKGYTVIGVKRRTSLISTYRIDDIFEKSNLNMYYGSMHETGWMYKLLLKYKIKK